MKLKKRFNSAVDSELIKKITDKFSLHEKVAEILVSRGYSSFDDVQDFLYPDISMLNDPFDFKNMEKVCDRIRQAGKEKVAVCSDYDTDGVSGAAILSKLLDELEIEHIVYIPDRFKDGYGISMSHIEDAYNNGVSLIISVDCGITNIKEAEYARSCGIDLIILDHHKPQEILPDTPYIINPHTDENYSFKYLCGTGVAFKLACAMMGSEAYKYIDIAAIATIGDIVNLSGENRVIASVGIDMIKTGKNVGINELCFKLGINPQTITSSDISFKIVPMLNSSGRMASAKVSFELLAASSRVRAAELANELCSYNYQRQKLQREIIKDVCDRVDENYSLSKSRIIMMSSPNYHLGVVGIAAANVAKDYNRPVVILKETDEYMTGSARSIDGIDIFEVLKSEKKNYLKFGGHVQAAGLTIKKDKFEQVNENLEKYLSGFSDGIFIKTEVYDAEIEPDEITGIFLNDLSLMEPFGEGNPTPVFLIKDAVIAEEKLIGKNEEHIKFKVQKNGASINAVKFFDKEMHGNVLCSVLGQIQLNSFDNMPQILADIITEKNSLDNSFNKNENEYMRSFISEAVYFAKYMDSDIRDKAVNDCCTFKKMIEESLKKGALGTCLAVNSICGLRTAVVEGLAKEMTVCNNGFPFRSSENVFCTNTRNIKYAKNYMYIFACGAFRLSLAGAYTLLTDDIISAYVKEAKTYFVDEQKLEYMLMAMTKIIRHRYIYDNIRQLLSDIVRECPTATEKQVWFAINIFTQLKLIEVKNSDKIIVKIIKNEQICTNKSGIYCAFEKLVERI